MKKLAGLKEQEREQGKTEYVRKYTRYKGIRKKQR